MKAKRKIFLAAALIFLQSFGTVSAAGIDEELAIFAAEQDPEDGTEIFRPAQKNTETVTPNKSAESAKKSRAEIKAEEKRLREEKKVVRQKAEEERQKLEEERKKLEEERKKIEEQRKKDAERKKAEESVKPVKPPVETKPLNQKPITRQFPKATQTPPQAVKPFSAVPNPVKDYENFEAVVQAVGFTPLYMPKKSGYTVNAVMTISENLTEIIYARRWEPEVALHVRTYKRPAGEELKDITGVHDVKWRTDNSTGISIYIARINERAHAATWNVGGYIFSAYTDNMTFAAFHSVVTDELVDLSRHYYILN